MNHEIKVDFNEQRLKSVYRKYFKFERQQALKKAHFWPVSSVFVAIIVFGLLYRADIILILGVIGALAFGIYMLYFFVRFKIAENNFIQRLIDQERNLAYIFSFDSEAIQYRSAYQNTEIKWALIKQYVVNDEDVYLYYTDNELFDIISAKVVGKSFFENFLAMLQNKHHVA